MSALASVPRETVEAGQHLEELPLSAIDVGENVRVNIADLEELAASIKEHGVLQPIKVRVAGDRWLVLWGQRRLLAAKQVGLETIPALVIADDGRAPAMIAIEQLVENLHRADLPALDRARAMRSVVDAGTSQVDLARELGLHPSTIANDLGLLEAPREIQKLIEDEALTPSHAKALKGLAAKTQVELAKQAVSRGSSAHELEQSVQQHKRSEEWRRERAAAERKAAEATKESRQASLANLEKKKVAKDAQVVVDPAYNGHAETVVAEIQALGYTNVKAVASGHSSARPKGDLCDCVAWRVVLGYQGKLSISRACVSDKHQRVKVQAEDQARKDKYELERLVHARLLEVAPDHVKTSPLGQARIHLTPLAARMALWHALGYRAADWAERHGGKRGNPWAIVVALDEETLAVELGKAIAESFRDNYGYHIPWGEIAEELGVVSALPEPATPKGKPKFTASQAAAAAAEMDAEGLT